MSMTRKDYGKYIGVRINAAANEAVKCVANGIEACLAWLDSEPESTRNSLAEDFGAIMEKLNGAATINKDDFLEVGHAMVPGSNMNVDLLYLTYIAWQYQVGELIPDWVLKETLPQLSLTWWEVDRMANLIKDKDYMNESIRDIPWYALDEKAVSLRAIEYVSNLLFEQTDRKNFAAHSHYTAAGVMSLVTPLLEDGRGHAMGAVRYFEKGDYQSQNLVLAAAYDLTPAGTVESAIARLRKFCKSRKITKLNDEGLFALWLYYYAPIVWNKLIVWEQEELEATLVKPDADKQPKQEVKRDYADLL